MKKTIAAFIVLILLVITRISIAQDNLTMAAVGEATLESYKTAIQDPFISGTLTATEKNAANELVDLLRNDLSFYKKLFQVVKTGANNTSSRPTTNFAHWTQYSLSYLGAVEVSKEGNALNFKVTFEDIRNKKAVYTASKKASLGSIRETGHKFAEEFFRSVTGKDSIFGSKMIFVSDRNSKGKHTVKELYMMDFDGKNVRQLTNHGGIAISPAVSPDGRRVVYSLIDNSRNRNNNLYLMDLDTKKSEMISNRQGINSGAVFIRDGRSIALTLTMSGNAEIYEMNLATKDLRRITNHFASDVDPHLTADGSLMTFLSNRPGKAMIYTMDPNGTENNVKRISFVGDFNATPRFSPDGKEIVFASWLDNSFDLFRINSNGQALSRLTKNFGSNEDPTFSNDGQFIAFTSQRVISRHKADQNIYIMDRDGDIFGAITGSFGNCISPRWFK